MARKLSKHQRYYRKRKKDSEQDFRKVEKDGPCLGIRVTRKPLKVNVSEEAFNRLAVLSDQAGVTRWEMLSRIIIKGLPRYASTSGSMNPTHRYDWPERLIHPTQLNFKYKGSTGDKQINYSITSTAWNKLQCHKTATGLSKARIVQSLLLAYKPLSPEQLEKNRESARQRSDEAFAYRASPNTIPKHKQPSFLDVGSEIIHVKGIPAEQWVDDELTEYEECFHKMCLRNLRRLQDQGKQSTQEWDYWKRMIATTGELVVMQPESETYQDDLEL